MFLAMWLVDAFYVQSSTAYFSDYMDYYSVYNGLMANYFEPGYYYIGLFAKQLGLNFFEYRLIIITITLLLMRNSILRYAKEPTWIALLYMIHPFLLQCIQIRNALSIAIVIYSLRFLTIEDKSIKKFVACIFVGTLFHTSTIFYSIILLCAYIKPRKIIPLSIGMLLFFEGLFGAFKIPLVLFLTKITNNYKIAYYLTTDETGLFTNSMLIYFLIYFMCVFVFLLFSKSYKVGGIDYVLLTSSILILSYIPIMLVHYDYFRIFEYFFPVIVMAMLNILKNRNINGLIVKIPVTVWFVSLTILRCITWIVDNNNEVLGNNILFR